MRKKGGTKSGPTIMMIMEASRVRVMTVPTVSDNSERRLAPKYWATITLAPVEIPTKSTRSKLIMGPLAPTAARALSPT